MKLLFPGMLLAGVFLFFSSGSVGAAGGVSMTMEPEEVAVGQTATLFVDVDPGGALLNIVQTQIRFDPAVWSVSSCTAHESFQGIAGQSACVIDKSGGTVKLQMEARSASGPKQKMRVAVIAVSRKGSENDTISMMPGQIVVQNDSGQSSLLPMPDMVGVSGSQETRSGERATGRTAPENPAPPLLSQDDPPRGFFQSIVAWFSRLFRFGR